MSPWYPQDCTFRSWSQIPTSYSEAIGLLYQLNTFCLWQTEVILQLPQVILPQRLEKTRRVEISSVLKKLSDWPAACRVLVSLLKLNSLQISVVLSYLLGNSHDPELLSAVPEPLKLVRAHAFSIVVRGSHSSFMDYCLGSEPCHIHSERRVHGSWCSPMLTTRRYS